MHNNNIKQLYLNIISNRITDKQKTIEQTDLRVDKNILNMGQFDWLQEQQGCFILKNIGRNRLVINDVITSCGCVSVDYNKSPIEIGGDFRLTVKYKAEYPEYINKSILLYCNVKDAPIKLKIKGDGNLNREYETDTKKMYVCTDTFFAFSGICMGTALLALLLCHSYLFYVSNTD